MNKIIILRGNCATGKTTAGKELQKKLGRGTLLIPQDIVRREMLWVKDTPNNSAIAFLKNIVDFGNKNCIYTILEGILYSNYYESLFDHIKKIYSEQIFAYYFVAPFDVTVKRQQSRPIHNEFGETEMKKWWREKDYIKNIQETTIDSLAMNSDEIVEKILKDIQ